MLCTIKWRFPLTARWTCWRGVRCPRRFSHPKWSGACLTRIGLPRATSNSRTLDLPKKLPPGRSWHHAWYSRARRLLMDAVDDGMAQVLRAIGEALVGDPVERDLQAVFEREVQQIAGMRVVRPREIPFVCH